MISIQTNAASLFAQEQLQVNTNFQNNTIQQLSSGYRINNSGNDPAGLTVANQYRSNIAELSQGLNNANDAQSQLQIIDGGLNNISQILDRLQTLATESATSTFTGNRTTVNNEYQTLLGEINRQADNIGLGTGSVGGQYNTQLSVYIGGGGGVQANSQVNINLSGASNIVNAAGLGLASTSVVGGGNNDISAGPDLNNAATYYTNGNQTFTFNFAGVQVQATVGNGGTGLTAAQAISQLNSQISQYGVTAGIDSTTGLLTFSGGNQAFNVKAGTAVGTGIATAAATAQNTGNYISNGATAYVAPATTTSALTFGVNGQNTTVTLAEGTTLTNAIAQLNAGLNSQGVYAVLNTAGTGIDFQSANAFTVSEAGTAAEGAFAATGSQTITQPAAGATDTGNALAAVTAVTNAVQLLGAVQGIVGAGENDLNYAISLATSQQTNFQAAEGTIRDANVAAEAADLTQAQTLQQTSIAALAQANTAPQAVLKLLQ